MNTKIKRVSTWIGAFVVIFIMAWLMLFPSKNERILAFQVRYGLIKIVPQSASYIVTDFDNDVDDSDVIFVGKVTGFSPTLWNQDSGEVWLGGLTYHTIQFEISQYIVDRIGLRDQNSIEVMLLEPSPLDGNNRDNGLSIGSVAVVFAKSTHLVWRDGTRPFIETIPASLYAQDDTGNFNGMVIHNFGKGKFTTFATPKGQEKYRLGMEERKTNPKKDPGGGGDFIGEWISISLPDFIDQIQAADQNVPFEFGSTATPTILPVEQSTGEETIATAVPTEIIQEAVTPTP